jgi:hypothetical protein
MAAEDATEGQPDAATGPVKMDSESGIFRAGRLKTAGALIAGKGMLHSMEHGRQHMVIGADESTQHPMRLSIHMLRGAGPGSHGFAGPVQVAATLRKIRSISVRS